MTNPQNDLPEVVVVGAAAMDMVARFEALPKPDSITFADSYDLFPGGAGANVACGISRLGFRTAFLGKLGDDDNGRLLKAAFESSGVDTRGVLVEQGQRSSACFIPVDAKGNRVIYALGGVALLEKTEEIKAGFLKQTKGLYIAEAFPGIALEIIRQCEASHPFIVYSPGGVMIWAERDALNKVIAKASVLLVSRSEAQSFTGETDVEIAARKLSMLGVPHVVITLGQEGSFLFHEDQFDKVKAHKLNNVVDTTGAGDAYGAGLLAGILSGNSVIKAMVWGNCAAAIKIGQLGARSGQPNLKELLGLIQSDEQSASKGYKRRREVTL